MTDHLRRLDGRETWNRLLEWDKGQAASERLASTILKSEGYDVDPSHPLGGQDGGKDSICRKDDSTLIGAAYFPRGQQTFKDIYEKFEGDSKGIANNNADGIVFVTNQYLKLSERTELEKLNPGVVTDLYHLERLTTVLNTPRNYGIRLESLGIRITEEELIAFQAYRDEQHYQRLNEINSSLTTVLQNLKGQTAQLEQQSGQLERQTGQLERQTAHLFRTLGRYLHLKNTLDRENNRLKETKRRLEKLKSGRREDWVGEESMLFGERTRLEQGIMRLEQEVNGTLDEIRALYPS